MPKYNEKKLPNGTVIFSSEKNAKGYPCWGLYDGKSGKTLLEPEYDSIPAWGNMNGHPVVFVMQGASKKIYLIDKQKLIFDDYELIGKDWHQIPELHSANYGDLYYVMKGMKFFIVDENGKPLAEFDKPVAGKVRVFDHGKKSYVIANSAVIELGTGKPLENLSLSSASRIVDAISIQDSLFLIVRKPSEHSSFSFSAELYSYDHRKTVFDYFHYESKQKWAVTTNAIYYMEDDDSCTKVDKDCNKKKIKLDSQNTNIIIGINNIVITSNFKREDTIDVDTGKKVMDGIAIERFEGTDLIKTASPKGPYNGITDYSQNRVLVLPIFDYIADGAMITCRIDKIDYMFNPATKTFDDSSTRPLLRAIFTTIDCKKRMWQ